MERTHHLSQAYWAAPAATKRYRDPAWVVRLIGYRGSAVWTMRLTADAPSGFYRLAKALGNTVFCSDSFRVR